MLKMERKDAIFLVLGLIWCCEGKFVVETSILRVSSPESLKGTYECAIGNFGAPDYGGSMPGTVVLPEQQSGCLP